MKLNAAVEDDSGFLAGIQTASIRLRHAPNTRYQALFQQLEDWLAEMTGFPESPFSPTPLAGELAGLLVIPAYHANQGKRQRKIALSRPQPRHEPRQCVMAGFRVMPVACDKQGNYRCHRFASEKLEANKTELAANGHIIRQPTVFRGSIQEICRIRPRHGGSGLYGWG